LADISINNYSKFVSRFLENRFFGLTLVAQFDQLVLVMSGAAQYEEHTNCTAEEEQSIIEALEPNPGITTRELKKKIPKLSSILSEALAKKKSSTLETFPVDSRSLAKRKKELQNKQAHLGRSVISVMYLPLIWKIYYKTSMIWKNQA